MSQQLEPLLALVSLVLLTMMLLTHSQKANRIVMTISFFPSGE
jgi:hypothetical protein